MDFALTDRCEDLRERLLAFMDEQVYPAEPLYHEQLLASADPHFWISGKVPEEVWSEAQLHRPGAAVLKRLGNFPFWRGKVGPVDALEPTYSAASPRGTRLLLGEREFE